MNLRWPRKVRLSGLAVKVAYVRQPKVEGEVCVGSFSRETHRIEIKRDLPPPMKFLVLMHEMFHAWYWMHANRPSLERLTEEEAVSMFSAAACGIMQDNPILRSIAAKLDGTP